MSDTSVAVTRHNSCRIFRFELTSACAVDVAACAFTYNIEHVYYIPFRLYSSSRYPSFVASHDVLRSVEIHFVNIRPPEVRLEIFDALSAHEATTFSVTRQRCLGQIVLTQL